MADVEDDREGMAPAGKGGAKILRGLAVVTHAVADLDAVESAWSAVPGYRTVERGRLPRDLCAAWNAPEAEGQRYCLMQPASGEEVYLRFVDTGERGHGPPATHGWIATELLVTDPDDLAKRLEGSAFRRLGGPSDLYPRHGGPRAMQVIGPSGELIYFTRLLPGGSLYGLKRAQSYVDRPFIVILGGPSGQALRAFYGGVLGLRILDRTPFVNSAVALRYAVPADTVFPTAVARIPGRRFLLQLDECPPGVAPRTRRPGHLPPGLAMVSFAVPDLDEIARLQAAVPTRAAPRAIEGVAYRGRRVAVIEGPVGEWLELIEDSR